MFIWSVVHSLQRLTKHCSPQAIHKRAVAPTTAVRITHLCIHTYAIPSYILVHSHTSTGRLSKIFALHCILAYTCTHTNWRWWCCCSVEKTREHNTCNIHPVGSAIGCRLWAQFMEIISWYINRRMLTPRVLSLGLYASDWDSCVACCAEKHTHYRIQDEPMIHTVSNWHGKEEKWLWFGTPNEEEHIVNYFNSFIHMDQNETFHTLISNDLTSRSVASNDTDTRHISYMYNIKFNWLTLVWCVSVFIGIVVRSTFLKNLFAFKITDDSSIEWIGLFGNVTRCASFQLVKRLTKH